MPAPDDEPLPELEPIPEGAIEAFGQIIVPLPQGPSIPLGVDPDIPEIPSLDEPKIPSIAPPQTVRGQAPPAHRAPPPAPSAQGPSSRRMPAAPPQPPSSRNLPASSQARPEPVPVVESVAPRAAGGPVLVDVTPRALVVETAGGFCDTVIPRNAKIPCAMRRQFSTAQDNQTAVAIRVAQGEEAQFGGNTFLGEVQLSGIPAGPRGTVAVEVMFQLDQDGRLRVAARDPKTGRGANAVIQLVGGVADEAEIRAMQERLAAAEMSKGESE